MMLIRLELWEETADGQRRKLHDLGFVPLDGVPAPEVDIAALPEESRAKLHAMATGQPFVPRTLAIRLHEGRALMAAFEAIGAMHERWQWRQWVANLRAGRLSSEFYDNQLEVARLKLQRVTKQVTSTQKGKHK